MSGNDLIRLRHMLDAAQEAIGFVEGLDRSSLEQDRLLVLGLLKCIEIVGEAAAKLQPETRARCPGIPWTDLVGMRNRLVHVYFDIDLDQVWKTVREDLPPLIVQLQHALESDSGPETAS